MEEPRTVECPRCGLPAYEKRDGDYRCVPCGAQWSREIQAERDRRAARGEPTLLTPDGKQWQEGCTAQRERIVGPGVVVTQVFLQE